MLPLVLACSFPFFGGPPPGGAVYGLLFYCPGPGSPNPDGLGQDLVRYTSFHEGIYARGVEPGWVVCYVRAEAVGPWVYRLAVAGCGDGREYQARMLNALLEGYRDAYVPWRRRDAAEHLRSWDEMLRRDAGRLREMRREATA
ncbi:MAG TPA: hypothetical protein VNK04_11395, partial [Gemmataceae bacterium]|nr:hypothetical protein [Gemmataceae bacterium]